MKKSEIYYAAQCAVLEYHPISHSKKLEILRVLMSDEELARFVEEKEDQGNEQTHEVF